jgi:RNA polymerase sigma-70 factor (ECF subfamily)
MNIDFQELYDKWYLKSFMFAKAYVQDHMIAEDLVSESIVKLWNIMKEKDIERPQALLLTLLKNKALDYLRRENMRQKIEEELADTYQQELAMRISTLDACNPETMFSRDIEEIIEQTLLSLPEQTRIIFEMSRYDGLSVKEIASKLNITPKAVEYHITRSLKALRVNLKDYLPFVFFFFFLNN